MGRKQTEETKKLLAEKSRQAHKRGVYKEVNELKRRVEIRKCLNCGKEFKVCPHETKKFCSSY